MIVAPFEPFDETNTGKKFSLMLIEEQVRLTENCRFVPWRGRDQVELVPERVRFSQLLANVAV